MSNISGNDAARLFFAPVESIGNNLLSRRFSASRLDEMKLKDFVLELMQIDIYETRQIERLSAGTAESARTPESFYEALQLCIRELQLFKLFTNSEQGEFHRSLCPAAYNERTGEHYPQEMAQWRADFRSMRPDQQMVAATIVWIYRGGSDSIWLRRVPCTWKASEALHYMRDAGCIGMWLQLITKYPGW